MKGALAYANEIISAFREPFLGAMPVEGRKFAEAVCYWSANKGVRIMKQETT